MLIGCTIFYDDGLELFGRCLRSLRPHVDKLVVVDGAFADLPHPAGGPSSAVDHLELAAGIADVMIPCPQGPGWETEIVKRNQYLVGDVGDWYLVVDADEEVVAFPYRAEDFTVTDAPGFRVWLVEGNQPRRSIMRVFRHTPTLRYSGAHNAVCMSVDSDRPINHECQPLSDALLRHYPFERAPERAAQDAVYISRMAAREAAYRARHKL